MRFAETQLPEARPQRRTGSEVLSEVFVIQDLGKEHGACSLAKAQRSEGHEQLRGVQQEHKGTASEEF